MSPPPDLRRLAPDRIVGALLGLACGDALGAPGEFLSREDLAARYPDGLRDMVGGGSFHWAPGEWTDDTAMALCVADGILSVPGDPVDGIGERFLVWEETARDVGNTIRSAIGNRRRHSEAPWSAAASATPHARNGRAAGNGSLMRTLPVALAYPDRATMRRRAAQISAMTHWDPQAESCCVLYCLFVRRLLRGETPATAWVAAVGEARTDPSPPSVDTPGMMTADDPLWDRLRDAPSRSADEVQPSGYAGWAPECLEAAIWAVLGATDAEAAILRAVALGGETDTIGAVAGGVAGAIWGLDALPGRWLRALHQRDRLEDTAHRLAELRHQLTYAPPGPPPFTWARLTDRLSAGRNPLTELDARELAEAGVTHVLDLREPGEWDEHRAGRPIHGADAIDALARHGVSRTSLPVPDGGIPSPAVLDAAVALLSRLDGDDAAGEAHVYVHCRAGRERTGAVLVAHLASRDGLSVDAALDRLRERSPSILPLPWQLDAVAAWLRERHHRPAPD